MQKVMKGIPQGSIVEPILLCISINELGKDIKAKTPFMQMTLIYTLASEGF